MLEKWVARKNKYKVVQAIFEITVCAAAVVWVVLSIRSCNLKQNSHIALFLFFFHKSASLFKFKDQRIFIPPNQ